MNYLRCFTFTFLLFFISETSHANKGKRSPRTNTRQQRSIKPDQQLARSLPQRSTDSARPLTDFSTPSRGRILPFVNRIISRGNGKYRLIHAVRNGDLALARSLIERGADINIQDGRVISSLATDRTPYWTPLMYAVTNNDLDMVGLLLDSGVDVNHAIQNGATPIMVASRYSSLETIDFLITKGARLTESLIPALNARSFDIEAALFRRGREAERELIELTASNNLEAIQFLINRLGFVNINTRDERGWTPLMIARFKDYSELERFLNGHGSKIYSRRLSNSFQR